MKRININTYEIAGKDRNDEKTDPQSQIQSKPLTGFLDGRN